VNITENDPGDQFGLPKQVNKQMMSLLGSFIKEMWKRRKAEISDAEPDINFGIEPDHPLCKEKGTIVVEMDCLIQEYKFNDVVYPCFVNLWTGECFGLGESRSEEYMQTLHFIEE
jgi:hypothetical protein